METVTPAAVWPRASADSAGWGPAAPVGGECLLRTGTARRTECDLDQRRGPAVVHVDVDIALRVRLQSEWVGDAVEEVPARTQMRAPSGFRRRQQGLHGLWRKTNGSQQQRLMEGGRSPCGCTFAVEEVKLDVDFGYVSQRIHCSRAEICSADRYDSSGGTISIRWLLLT